MHCSSSRVDARFFGNGGGGPSSACSVAGDGDDVAVDSRCTDADAFGRGDTARCGLTGDGETARLGGLAADSVSLLARDIDACVARVIIAAAAAFLSVVIDGCALPVDGADFDSLLSPINLAILACFAAFSAALRSSSRASASNCLRFHSGTAPTARCGLAGFGDVADRVDTAVDDCVLFRGAATADDGFDLLSLRFNRLLSDANPRATFAPLPTFGDAGGDVLCCGGEDVLVDLDDCCLAKNAALPCASQYGLPSTATHSAFNTAPHVKQPKQAA